MCKQQEVHNAVTEMISSTNRLNNEKLKGVEACLHPSAIDKTLRRSQNYILENKSGLVSVSTALTKQMASAQSASKTGGKSVVAPVVATSSGSLQKSTAPIAQTPRNAPTSTKKFLTRKEEARPTIKGKWATKKEAQD